MVPVGRWGADKKVRKTVAWVSVNVGMAEGLMFR